MVSNAQDVIAQALALSEAASDGPWNTYSAYGSLGVGVVETEEMVFIQDGGITYAVRDEDATFTAAARTLLPALAKALGDVLALADGCDNVARSHADKATRDTHRSIAFDLRGAIADALSEVTP